MTAYGMRISDWSSDVCSSDLSRFRREFLKAMRDYSNTVVPGGKQHIEKPADPCPIGRRPHPVALLREQIMGYLHARQMTQRYPVSMQRTRSEEHTSELQSLMRISYAVFCLIKKKQHHT